MVLESPARVLRSAFVPILKLAQSAPSTKVQSYYYQYPVLVYDVEGGFNLKCLPPLRAEYSLAVCEGRAEFRIR